MKNNFFFFKDLKNGNLSVNLLCTCGHQTLYNMTIPVKVKDLVKLESTSKTSQKTLQVAFSVRDSVPG